MKERIDIVNGEEYLIKIFDSGHFIKELKMTEVQKAVLSGIRLDKTLEEKVDELLIKVASLEAALNK